MRKLYKRKAWLIDDGIIVMGHVSKRIFYPDSFSCGFLYQKIRRKDISRIVFYDERAAKAKLNGVWLSGEHTYAYR